MKIKGIEWRRVSDGVVIDGYVEFESFTTTRVFRLIRCYCHVEIESEHFQIETCYGKEDCVVDTAKRKCQNAWREFILRQIQSNPKSK